jgi:polysaccharide chain length determinant protein (PEP-CTERM system associated)
MHPRVHQVIEDVHGAWRYRWLALGIAWGVCLVGWVALFFVPDMYEANARVFVDTRTALKPVLQGLAVEQDLNSQLNYVSQSLLATPELERIAKETGLLTPDMSDPHKRGRVIDHMSDRVKITFRSAANLPNERDAAGSVYGISYSDKSRDRSIQVVDDLLNTLVQQTLGGKRQGSQDAQNFLETQIKDYEQRLGEAEQRLADFKKANVGAMPGQQGGYFERLQTEMDALRTTENALGVAESRRVQIRQQLRGESAVTSTMTSGGATTGSGAKISAGSGDVLSRIAETQAKLDDLLLKFTDKHPDVIATRETLEELKHRREQEVDALRSGDPEAVATSGAASNPVYQSIQMSLNQSELEIATLNKQVDEHRARVAELRQAVGSMPQVEAQFAQLNRDYDVNKAQFTALLTQYEKAKLGQQAETSGSVRFDIIEPTNADLRPKTPRRGLLIAAILVGSVVLGAGAAFLRHKMTPVFWSAKALSTATGIRILGVVSGAFPEQLGRTLRRDAWWYSAAAAGLLLFAVGAVRANQLGLRFVLPPLG